MRLRAHEWVLRQLAHWPIGPWGHGLIGPLAHGPIGPLAHWPMGPLAHWPLALDLWAVWAPSPGPVGLFLDERRRIVGLFRRAK